MSTGPTARGRSELHGSRQLQRTRRVPVEPRQVVRAVESGSRRCSTGCSRRVLNTLKMFAAGSIDWRAERKMRPIFSCRYFGIVVADLAVAAGRSLEAQARRERVGLRRAVGEPDGRRAELRHLRIVGRQLDQQRAHVAAGLDDVAAADADAPRRDPLAADAQRERPVGRARFTAAAVQRVVVAVAEQLLRQIAVVRRTHPAARSAPGRSGSRCRSGAATAA